MPYPEIPDEIRNLFIKIIIPALVAMSIKLAVQSRKGKISLFSAIASIAIGVGCAYLSANWVLGTFSDELMPIAIAVITIAGEKVAYWLIFKFNFDVVGDAFIDYITRKYRDEK